eukprot:5996980-Amphidinium_carterae.1
MMFWHINALVSVPLATRRCTREAISISSNGEQTMRSSCVKDGSKGFLFWRPRCAFFIFLLIVLSVIAFIRLPL